VCLYVLFSPSLKSFSGGGGGVCAGYVMCGVFSLVVVLKSVARWRVRSGDVRDFGVF
jgi:hypothetical protein